MISPRAKPANVKNCPLCAHPLTTVDIGGKDRLSCGSEACEFIHWNNPLPVTATLVPMDQGIVLVKRKFEPFIGTWCLPGGFMENAEHPAESAKREVLEETGLNVEIHGLVGATAPGHGINVVVLFYLAKPTSGILIAGDDASEVRVFSYEELPNNISFEMHRRLIHQYFSANGSFLEQAGSIF